MLSVSTSLQPIRGADSGKSAPTRILLLKDGDIGWENLDGVELDAKTADRLIKGFDKHGADLPIDYHHATTDVEDGKVSKAPAAGWIKSLEYVKGQGLFAVVEWTDAAKAEIESKQFKYISPVIFTDKKTKAIQELHSVALTNKPRTIDAPELIAAAAQLESRMKGDEPMKKYTKAQAAKMRRPTSWRKLTAQDEPLPGIDVDTEALPQDQVTALEDAGTAVDALAEALTGQGIDVPDGADTDAIIGLAVDFIAGAGAAPAEGEDENPADEVAAALGMKKGTKLKKLIGEIGTLKVKAGGSDDVATRLTEVEKELASYRERDKIESAEGLIRDQIKAGKINPNNTDHLEACKKMAIEDPERFSMVFAHAPVIMPPDGVTVTAGGSRETGKTTRDRIIASGKAEYDKLSETERELAGPPRGWINAKLDDARMPFLTNDELEKLEA